MGKMMGGERFLSQDPCCPASLEEAIVVACQEKWLWWAVKFGTTTCGSLNSGHSLFLEQP